jgi:uncharacterized protein (TIGR00725 family)
MKRFVVGVMGPGDGATAIEQQQAFALGGAIAAQGWVLLTGGRNVGVMDAACQGAKQASGLTIGILPGSTTANASAAIDIAICTNLGNARNAINVLSSDVVIACGMGTGTASEIALALKEGKPVILLSVDAVSTRFFQQLGSDRLQMANTVEEAIEWVRRLGVEGSSSEQVKE